MTIYLPTEIRENITIINRVPWGWGRITPTHWHAVSMKNKHLKLQKASELFTNLQPPGYVATLYMTRRKKNWREELAGLKSRTLKKYAPALQDTIDAWVEYIESTGNDEEYEFYIAFQLENKTTPLMMLSNLLDVEYERIWPFADEILTDEKLLEYTREFQKRVQKYNIEPLSAREIAEFYRDHNYLGMKKPTLDEALFASGRWKTPDTTWLMPNPIEAHDKYVRIEGQWETRYVCFVSVALFPNRILSPGFDLFYEIQSWGLPVEAMIRWSQRDPKMTRFFASQKYRAAKSNNEHVREVGETTIADEETELHAELFHKEVTKQSMPMNIARIVFKLTASDPEELDDLHDTFIEELNNKGVIAERNRGDQDLLYDQWLPVNRWRVVGYRQELLPNRTAAIVMPGISEVCGDPDGLPHGKLVVNGRPFRLFLPYGVMNDRPSVVVVNGPTGSGKTHLAYEIALNTLKTIPSRVIIEDPKDEKKDIEQYFRDVDVRVITLNGNQYPGVLDPFGLIQDLAKAKQKAISLIQQATYLFDAESEDIITEAVDRVGFKAASEPGYTPSMGKVIEELKTGGERAQRIARWLERVSRLQLGQLIFGDRNAPGAKSFDLPTTGLIFLKIAGLSLPERGQEAVDIEQKVSQAVNYGKNILIHQFLLEGKEKGIFSCFVNDESWKDFQNPYSGRETENFTRLGRSGFCGVIFCTQNPSDIPESVLNNCGTYICLGVETEEEAYLAMKQLRVDPNEEHIANDLLALGATQSEEALLQSRQERTSSRGYVRDLFGRTALVEFITPQAEMRSFLKSRPDEIYREEEEEEQTAATSEKSPEETYIEVV